MGLIDLKTDLKSLKYSKDRIGGGSSNQPFVQKSIPDGFDAVGNTGGLDVLTRGGSLIFQSIADDASRLTKLLLTPDTFQGPAFTIKQNVLSRQNVQTQASPKGLNQGAYLPTSTIAQAIVNAEGLHFNTFGKNPIPGSVGSLTTYSDVVEGSFLSPGIKSLANNRLLRFTNTFVNSPTLDNTLYSYPGGPGSILGIGKTRITIPGEQRTGINRDNVTSGTIRTGVTLNLTDGLYKINGFKDLNELLGASNSAGLQADFPGASRGTNTLITPKTAPKGDRVTGINSTENSRYAIISDLNTDENVSLFIPNITPDGLYEGNKPSAREKAMGTTPFTGTEDLTKPTSEANKQTQAQPNLQSYTYTQEQLQQAPSYRTSANIQDFRKQLRNINNPDAKAVGANVLAPSYTDQNIEKRVHLGNPGLKGDVSDYSKGKKDIITGNRLGALDKINALPLYQSDTVAKDNEKDVDDLVKFRIAVMDSNGTNSNGTSTKTFIHFRAFLNNISDNFTSDWQAHKYVGRGENFYTYNGFDRKVSLSWTVYAQSREELIPMYKKLNYLASSLAPDYNNGFMRGVLVQLTIGGYFYNQPGFITGLTYDLTEESTWEIGINDKGFSDPANRGDDLVKELPHMIKVSSFNFTPIHRFIPEVQKNRAGSFVTTTGLGNGPQRYIALDSGYDNNYDSGPKVEAGPLTIPPDSPDYGFRG